MADRRRGIQWLLLWAMLRCWAGYLPIRRSLFAVLGLVGTAILLILAMIG